MYIYTALYYQCYIQLYTPVVSPPECQEFTLPRRGLVCVSQYILIQGRRRQQRFFFIFRGRGKKSLGGRLLMMYEIYLAAPPEPNS